MTFETMNAMDDQSKYTEASDIISQEEEISVGVAESHVKYEDGNNKAVGPEWSDPWSTDPWKTAHWADPSSNNQSRIESSFESLQFTPVIRTAGENSDLFGFEDAFGAPFGPIDTPARTKAAVLPMSSPSISKRASSTTTPSPKKVVVKESKINLGVVLKERLSIFFDETTNGPSCKVVGSIYVKPTKRRIDSFALTIRDSRNHVEHWDERNSRCRNITAAVPHLALDAADQVFSIAMNRDDQHNQSLDAPVVNYTCIPRLRPMPMLLKTKCNRKSDRCRLGVRIRANPQNSYVLRDFVVLIIVPPKLDGENVTMSRRGGVWNDMKRSLVWNISKLDPGEIIDIQAQFKSTAEQGGPSDGAFESQDRFAVLARCKGDSNFSKIDLDTDYKEDGSCTVEMDLERSATILYRKI